MAEALKTIVFVAALGTAAFSRRSCLAIVAFFLPLQAWLPGASFKGVNALNLLLLVAVLHAFLSERAPNPPNGRDPILKPVLILLLMVFVSLMRVQFNSDLPAVFLQDRGLYNNIVDFKGMVVLVVLYYCARRMGRYPDIVRYAVAGALGGFVVQAVAGASGFLGGYGLENRATGHFRGSALLGHFLAAYVALPVAALVQGVRGRFWFASVVAVALSAMGVLGSLSRAALLAFGAGITSIAAVQRSTWVVVIAVGILTAPVWIPEDHIERFRDSVSRDPTGLSSVPGFQSAEELDLTREGRFKLWSAGVKMVVDKPVFGVGLGLFDYLTPDYGYKGSKIRAAHNVPLGLAAECGIIAALAHLWILATLAIYMLRLARLRPRTFSSILGLGLFGSTVVFAISNMSIPDFYRSQLAGPYFILVGIAISLYSSADRNSKPHSTSDSQIPRQPEHPTGDRTV